MSIRHKIRDVFYLRKQEEAAPQAHTIINIASTETVKKPYAPLDFASWQGVPRVAYGGGPYIDANELRMLASTPTPMMCIQRLVEDVQNTQWNVIPLAKDNQTEPDIDAISHARSIRDWLWQGPNANRESFAHILSKVVADLTILDAGVMHKEYAIVPPHPMVQLWTNDGGLFTKEIDVYQRLGVKKDVQFEDGMIKDYHVGYWYNPYGSPQVPWEPHEIVYMMQHPRTDTPYGTSKMFSLKTIIGALMYGEEYYHNFFETGGTGNIVFSTEEALTDPQWQEWRQRIKSEMDASYFKTMPLDRKPSVTTFGTTPQQMQWLETRSDYRQMVLAMLNVTGEVLGFTSDIHKATAESQRSVYIRRGLWPLLKNIEWYINTQVITEFYWQEERNPQIYQHMHKGKWAGKPIDTLFRFKLFDPLGEQQQLEIDEKNLKDGLTTVNEIRKRNGLSALKWGDINPQFLLNPQQWSQSWFYGAFDDIPWENATGMPAPTKVLESVKPAASPAEDVKAFKRSRIEATATKAKPQ